MGLTERLQTAWLSRGALSGTLWPLAAVFGLLSGARRRSFELGWRRVERLPVAVVVVGNLVVGGAGKTPTVLAVVTLLRRHGYTPGIVSRGYGRRGAGLVEVTSATPASRCGDEPLLMGRRSGAPVVVDADRVRAARRLLLRHPQVDVIVSDDGLQHLALARDAQILVFDERGAGNGRLLPAGPLREPLPRAVPERSLVVYNAAAPTTAWSGTLAHRSIGGVVELRDWWAGVPPSPALLDALRGRPLLAVAGVARPERFFQMLRDRGLTVQTHSVADHWDYATLPWSAAARDVILTEKDAVKIDPGRCGATRVWVAPLDFALDAGFENALLALLPPPGSRHGNTTP